MRLPVVSTAIVAILLGGLLAFPASADHHEKVTAKKLDDRVRIEIGGELFTEYLFKHESKPICFPIIAPDGQSITRHWPMREDRDGEAHDHPHHESLWFTHQLVNGTSFWHVNKGSGQTVHEKFVKVESGDRAVIKAKNKWVGPEGKIFCTDTRTLTFFELDNGDRVIDYDVSLHASHGKLTLGDAKDGVLGIRMHPALRIDKGAHAVNSEGDTGKPVWGKRAKWIDYSAKVDGKPAGIAIFDHPRNLRHPTWWHARAYGLLSANPLGISYFEKKDRGAGEYVIEDGDTLRFQYRIIFHRGSAVDAEIDQRYSSYAGQ